MTTLTSNDRRAMRIGHILTWCQDWSSGCEGLIDLLTDARHWCDRNGECFGDLDRIAYQHYLDERRSALPPDPERMNDKRAAWAGRAVTAFQGATGTDEEDALSDLIADLMHWADRNNYDFEAARLRGRDHYEAETIGEEPSEPSGPIIIEVRGGVVQDVLNVPPGYHYQVKDYDDLEADGEAADGRSA